MEPGQLAPAKPYHSIFPPPTTAADKIDDFYQVAQKRAAETMQERMLRKTDGKLPLSIVPQSLLEATAEAMNYGAKKKYARDDWRKGAPWTEITDCLLRHLTAWLDGEDLDSESGLSHISHAAANMAFLAEFTRRKVGTDDRYQRP